MQRKRLLLCSILSFLLCFSLVVSVNGASMWSQTYGGAGQEMARSLVATSDGGYAITGAWNYAGSTDFWLVKTDALGNMEWNQTYGNPGTGYEVAYSLVATSDGGYALAGLAGTWPATSFSPNYTSFRFWLVKTDSFGNMEWNRTYGQGKAHSLVSTSDGGYAMAGYPYSDTNGANVNAWLVKNDAAGNMQWNQTYGGTEVDTAYSLVATSDGGYALAGHTRSFGAGNADFWLVKTDTFGNMLWSQTYGGEFSEEASSLVATADGGYAIAGYAQLTGSTDFWLVKTDALGNVEWNQTYGATGPGWGSSLVNTSDTASSLVATSDGGYAIVGRIHAAGESVYNAFWLVKTDAFGNMEWNQTYEKNGSEFEESLIRASDGGYAIAGYTRVENTSQTDFWVVKTNEFGVVPEYTSWLIPAFVLTATAFTIVNRKRWERKRSEAERKRRRAT